MALQIFELAFNAFVVVLAAIVFFFFEIEDKNDNGDEFMNYELIYHSIKVIALFCGIYASANIVLIFKF